jgi:hypothetical protein
VFPALGEAIDSGSARRGASSISSIRKYKDITSRFTDWGILYENINKIFLRKS